MPPSHSHLRGAPLRFLMSLCSVVPTIAATNTAPVPGVTTAPDWSKLGALAQKIAAKGYSGDKLAGYTAGICDANSLGTGDAAVVLAMVQDLPASQAASAPAAATAQAAAPGAKPAPTTEAAAPTNPSVVQFDPAPAGLSPQTVRITVKLSNAAAADTVAYTLDGTKPKAPGVQPPFAVLVPALGALTLHAIPFKGANQVDDGLSATYSIPPTGNTTLDNLRAKYPRAVINPLDDLAERIKQHVLDQKIPLRNSAAINRFVNGELENLDLNPTGVIRVKPSSQMGGYIRAYVRANLQAPASIPVTAKSDDLLRSSGLDAEGRPNTAEEAMINDEASYAAQPPVGTATGTGDQTGAPSQPGAKSGAANPSQPSGGAAGNDSGNGVLTGGIPDGAMLASGKFQIGSTLKLYSANLFQGRAYLFQYPDSFNIELTSSLPGSAPNEASSTEYGDAELSIPDGGALNLRIGLLSSIAQTRGLFGHSRADYMLPNSGVAIYADRADSYDRYYFDGGNPSDANNPASKLDIETGRLLFYFRDGFDAKLIYRGGNASAPAASANVATVSSNFGDYGTSFGYYLGLGMDGGLFGQQATFFGKESGDFRGEIFSEYQIVDRNSLFNATYVSATQSADGTATPASYLYGGLYPKVATMYLSNSMQSVVPVANFKYPSPDVATVGANFSLNLSNNVSIGLTGALPIGGCRGYMGKTLLGSVTIKSLGATPPSSSNP